MSVIYNLNILYMERSLGLGDHDKAVWGTVTSVLIGVSIIAASLPAARAADRYGRKAVIYASCLSGAAGMGVLVVAPSVAIALVGILLVALGAGSFLSVDWALMTDIIPKAASGRYMGMSNVATASAGPVSLIVGGPLLTLLAGGTGPRAAMAVGIAFFLVGAVLLRPVDPRRRMDVAPAGSLVGAQTGPSEAAPPAGSPRGQ